MIGVHTTTSLATTTVTQAVRPPAQPTATTTPSPQLTRLLTPSLLLMAVPKAIGRGPTPVRIKDSRLDTLPRTDLLTTSALTPESSINSLVASRFRRMQTCSN